MSKTKNPTGLALAVELFERAPVGTFGPFGPIEAHNSAEARRIAAARAASSGLHLDRIEKTR